MPTDAPIACSLTAPEMSERVGEMAAVGQVSLIGSEATGAQAILRFRRDAETFERLAAIVAAESECCAFLDMTLADSDDTTVLTITAPDGAEPVLGEIVAAFTGGRSAV